MAEEVEKQQQQPEETRKRKDEDEGDEKKQKKTDEGSGRGHKHPRTRGSGGPTPADVVRLLAGVLGGGGGGPGGQGLTAAQRQEREVFLLLKAATKNSVGMDMRAEALRRALAFAETVRPASWAGLDQRIAELRQAVETSNAIVLSASPAALAQVVRTAEPTWPLGKIPYNSHRWSIKIVRQMAKQKAYQLVMAQN